MRGKLLLDTKPLTRLLLECIGLEEEAVSRAVALLGLPVASVWPVFTETLYFMGKKLKGRRDKAKLLQNLKRCLQSVGEVAIAFHEAAAKLDEELDIADTTLLQALRKQLAILVSEDSKLVGKARKQGLQAVTLYEFLTLTGLAQRQN